MASEILCTRRDFERAGEELLRWFQKNGYASRRELSAFRALGISYEAIELAVRDLKRRNIIEELYTLPPDRRQTGQRKEYYALVTALDAHAVELPEYVVRESKAFELIADYESVA